MNGKCYVIEKDKIAENIRVLRQRVGDRRIYAVLKSDGYGIGVANMAALCAENGLKCFMVCDLEAARAVRVACPDVEEILLTPPADPAEVSALVELGVSFTVSSEMDAERLAPYGAKVHIKIDSGMGRRGFLAEDIHIVEDLYRKYSDLKFVGIYTHFADGPNAKKTNAQFARFQKVLQALEADGIDPGIRHCCSSTSVFRYDDLLLDGVRIGSALLGRVAGGESAGLQRTGICRVTIEAVRKLPKGATVGYGSLYRTKRETWIAACSIGTHYGVGVTSLTGKQRPIESILQQLRSVKSQFSGMTVPVAYINEKACPALGTICSEMVILDVTGVACQPGDTATFDINPMYAHAMPIVIE